MNIQVINFEICKDHYQITRMLKTTSQNEIEYMPFHCYKKKEVDCYLLISKAEQDVILAWCKAQQLPLNKVIVLTNKMHDGLISWQGINLFDQDVDFEKICQWLMVIKEKSPNIDLFTSCVLKVGKIRKDHDYHACVHAIMKQNPGMKNGHVFLFVKEKSHYLLNLSSASSLKLNQYYLKGIAETYDYLLVS